MNSNENFDSLLDLILYVFYAFRYVIKYENINTIMPRIKDICKYCTEQRNNIRNKYKG